LSECLKCARILNCHSAVSIKQRIFHGVQRYLWCSSFMAIAKKLKEGYGRH